ncbi:hypothetical protein GE061_008862, partial [Apolygus lucorum]
IHLILALTVLHTRNYVPYVVYNWSTRQNLKDITRNTPATGPQ